MAQRRGGLGRGLDSLIRNPKAGKTPDKPAASQSSDDNIMSTNARKAEPSEFDDIPVGHATTEPAPSLPEGVSTLRINEITPNREQPRKEFDKEHLEELASSIKQYGIIAPLLVQKKENYYELIAGERRWRAARMAGLSEVPVVIREMTEQEGVEMSLIENIQREDLSPIEEANAYARLADEFKLTQEEIAKRVSKSRTTITNAMRLLRLPEEVQAMLAAGDITEGHARAILSLLTADDQIETARKIAQEGLSVRETEKLVRAMTHPKARKTRQPGNVVDEVIYRNLEEQLSEALGTKVRISPQGKNKGRIEIEYYSTLDLDRLSDILRSAGKLEV